MNGRTLLVTTPEPPPEARLITQLREAMIPPLSMREAARRAGISPALWTQNENGWRKVAPGITVPIRARPDKLALMAMVVQATPEQLETAGRKDAAVILRKYLDAGPDASAQIAEVVRQSRDFTDQQKQALIQLIERDRR